MEREEPGCKGLSAPVCFTEALRTRDCPGLNKIEAVLLHEEAGILHQGGEVVIQQQLRAKMRPGFTKTEPGLGDHAKLTKAGSDGIKEFYILLGRANHDLPSP